MTQAPFRDAASRETASPKAASSKAAGARWIGPALWLGFAAMVVCGGLSMLRACGTGGALALFGDFCPAPPDERFAREVSDGEALRRQVHAAEMALADVPPCPAPAPSPPVSRPPPRQAAIPQQTPEEREESQGIDRRVEQRGGKRGRLQITLAWNTVDDLDLNITCPGGRISSFDGEQGPGICGDGVKDLDANRNLKVNVSTTPVENVRWTDDVPEGRYSIEVIEYKAAKQGGNRVPFTLRMRLDDAERECHGAVVQFSPREMVKRRGETISGKAQQLIWSSDGPLPACDFVTVSTVRGNNPK